MIPTREQVSGAITVAQETLECHDFHCDTGYEDDPSVEFDKAFEESLAFALSILTAYASGELGEVGKLREFVDYILQEGSWQGCDIDGGDAQDKAEALGLLELRPIPEERSIDGEKEHYFTVWTPHS